MSRLLALGAILAFAPTTSRAQTAQSAGAFLRSAFAAERGDADRAAQELGRALVFDPSSPFLVGHASGLPSLGLRLDRVAERAIELEPRSPRAWLAAGRAREASGELNRAERAYRTTIRLDRTCLADSGEAELRLAFLALERGRDKESIRLLTRGRRRCPEAPANALALARLLASRGEFADAAAVLDRAPAALHHVGSTGRASTLGAPELIGRADRERLAALALAGRASEAKALAESLALTAPEDRELMFLLSVLSANDPARAAAWAPAETPSESFDEPEAKSIEPWTSVDGTESVSARSFLTLAVDPTAPPTGPVLFRAFAERPSSAPRALAFAAYLLSAKHHRAAREVLRFIPRSTDLPELSDAPWILAARLLARAPE
ncbi:MAG: hypothetical protein HY791_18750 [Deltaproteobacteria bacterium]|nr:hypothetical protein [Deltaproteobacteria bacterium]